MSAAIAIKKVLVLCQRKAGFSYDGKTRIETSIIPEIESIVYNIIQSKNYSIEYLSDISRFLKDETGKVSIENQSKVDINGFLKMNDEFTNEFLKMNRNSYSIIILHTCPFIAMPYYVIYDLLINDGYMILSAEDGFNINNVKPSTVSKFGEYIPLGRFINVSDDYYTKKKILIYKKIMISGGKISHRHNIKKKNKKTQLNKHKYYTKNYTKKNKRC